jgi:hypothetical protein
MNAKNYMVGALVAAVMAGAGLPALAAMNTQAPATAVVAAATATKPDTKKADKPATKKADKPAAKKGDNKEMKNAASALKGARTLLNKAPHDYKGHRAAAVKLVEQALDEVQKGIDSDK